jgi:septation ring formation regulator EzrA
MRINPDQFNRLTDELRDMKAAMKAIEAQLAAVIGEINKLIETQEDTNARISFQRRPRP